MQKTRVDECMRSYAGGVVTEKQWLSLGRLARSPQKTMIIASSLSEKYTMTESDALALINVGVAKFAKNRKLVVTTEYGLELVSAHGIEGR
ncbi:MAG: hypothetical protein GY841_15790 [FCB group bacterium]|nr:hypothetical protein [FCB group bacterium]